ncbi:hypothetical protein BJV82DRAFT_254878 [Fennellomyces sp. T-0311]|nr:hypothetical protein BJV82DRAFT_254878 [Fennellomyces sp. T-0311]
MVRFNCHLCRQWYVTLSFTIFSLFYQYIILWKKTRPYYYRQRSRESHHDAFSHTPREDPNDRIEVFSDLSASPPPPTDDYHSDIESFGDQEEAVNEAPPPIDRNQTFDFDAPLFTPDSQYQPETFVYGTPSPPYSPRTPGWALNQDTPEIIPNSETEDDTIPYDPDEPPTQLVAQQQQQQPQEPLHREVSQHFVDDNSQIILSQPSQPQRPSTATREQNTLSSLDLPESQQANKAGTQSTLDKYVSQNLSQTLSQSVEELFEGLSQGSALSVCKSTQELSSQPSGSQSQKRPLMEYRRVIKNGGEPLMSSQDASQHDRSPQEGRASQPWLTGTPDDSCKNNTSTPQLETPVQHLSQPSSSGSSKENKNTTQCEQSIQTIVEKADQPIQCSSQPWTTLQVDARKQSKKSPQSRKHNKASQGSSSSARTANTTQSSLPDYYPSHADNHEHGDEASNATSASSSTIAKSTRSNKKHGKGSSKKSEKGISKSTLKPPSIRVGLNKNKLVRESKSLQAVIAKRNDGNRRMPSMGLTYRSHE